MPEERIIPAVESVAEFRISIAGEELPRTVAVEAVHVSKVVNKIAMAKFIVRDGDAAESNFLLSNSETFLPGNEVVITAGAVDDQVPVFSGIIIKHSISIRDNRPSQLIIECKHKAVKATQVRRSNCFHDVTDDEAINTALSASGLSTTDIDLESTIVTHPEMVQYNSTDWDFAISRAEANGKIILTNDDKIVMKSPDFLSPSVLSLLYGATIMELDAEMDSRNQFKSVIAKTWDKATQTITETTAAEPSLGQWGNTESSILADAIGQEEFVLQHSGAIDATEMQVWADAQLLKSRMARIRGRVKFEGIATVNAGDVVELHGLGDRFNGNAFVTGVRHDYNAREGWKTQAQFGGEPDWFLQEHSDAVVAKASALLPGAVGLHTGVVTDNEDPEGEFRIKVKLPFINPDDDGVWARIALTDAGNQRGLYFRPEINDEVLIGFLFDDPRQPVILGMLHSSALPSPIAPSNDNHQKGYTSREKLVMLFDDEKKEVSIQTPGGNKIIISDDKKGIALEDQNGNKVELNNSGIKITSQTAIEITATTDLKLSAANISLAGNAGLSMSGGGSTKVESSGILELKGSLVKIN